MANGGRHAARPLEAKAHGVGQQADRQGNRQAESRQTGTRVAESSSKTSWDYRGASSIEAKLDEWYAESQEPMAVVIARNGVIVVAKAYGKVEEEPVTIDTPMLLHSAMKPLIGLQLAMYVDQGFKVERDELDRALTQG